MIVYVPWCCTRAARGTRAASAWRGWWSDTPAAPPSGSGSAGSPSPPEPAAITLSGHFDLQSELGKWSGLVRHGGWFNQEIFQLYLNMILMNEIVKQGKGLKIETYLFVFVWRMVGNRNFWGVFGIVMSIHLGVGDELQNARRHLHPEVQEDAGGQQLLLLCRYCR